MRSRVQITAGSLQVNTEHETDVADELYSASSDGVIALLAQRLERVAVNHEVASSNLAEGVHKV